MTTLHRLTARTVAAPLSAADLTARLERLRQQLTVANGEWADQIEGDIRALERMLTEAAS